MGMEWGDLDEIGIEDDKISSKIYPKFPHIPSIEITGFGKGEIDFR
jgi:hypothetical protein